MQFYYFYHHHCYYICKKREHVEYIISFLSVMMTRSSFLGTRKVVVVVKSSDIIPHSLAALTLTNSLGKKGHGESVWTYLHLYVFICYWCLYVHNVPSFYAINIIPKQDDYCHSTPSLSHLFWVCICSAFCCMYVLMYVCMYVCMYVYVCVCSVHVFLCLHMHSLIKRQIKGYFLSRID